MALLNRLSPFSAFRNGSSFSLTSRLGLRRTWNPSNLASRWRFHSAHISSIKPIAQFTSDAGQLPEPYSHISACTQGKRILWVDLSAMKYGLGEVVKYPDDSAGTWSWNHMLKKLRQLVKEDMQKAPSERIDSVLWYPRFEIEPTAREWKTLDGLSPKHLALFPTPDIISCRIKPLNTLQHQWNDLESLTLHNIGACGFIKRAPKIFCQISSLTLNHCVGPEHFPRDLTRLKHLRTLENGACDMFCYGVDNVANFTKFLEVLEIESTNGCDLNMYYPQDFKDRLRKCTNIREFRLTAGYMDSLDTYLAFYIPPSVEKLTLRYTRSLPFLHYFGDWIEHASDKTWLPHLKSFQLTVDPDSRVGGLEGDTQATDWTRNLENPPREFSPEAFDVKFEKKRRVLYGVLKSNRPFVDLLT